MTGMDTDDRTADAAEAPPPLLRTWRNLYLLVLGELLALVAIFWALTRWAS
ncbi:MAG TPA: hypothetical protein VEC57_17315 [Candidatus Limnocylindrales bacterium]|nr:hypothetical protein [Candidatus Limnocylindrales bacterium]